MSQKSLAEAAAPTLAKLRPRTQPGIDRYEVKDRASWLAMRQQDVTASAAGALLGTHDYLTPFELWALKTGAVQEDPEETGPMLRGRLLEPVAVQLLREQRPTWKVWQPNAYFRDPAARLGATPDVFAEDPERGFGIVQLKSVEPSVFRRKWRDEAGEVSPPLWIAVQGLIEAHLAGAKWACVAAMTVGFGLDLHIVEIPLHVGVIERVRGSVADFWAMVERGETPAFDFARDADLIARLYADDDGSEIDLTGDNMIPAIAAEDAILAAEIKERSARRAAIKAEIMAKMGTATFARIQGGHITAKTVNRKAYSVEATSYRSPRIKLYEPREAAE